MGPFGVVVVTVPSGFGSQNDCDRRSRLAGLNRLSARGDRRAGSPRAMRVERSNPYDSYAMAHRLACELHVRDARGPLSRVSRYTSSR
jgi:hypothetical protein